MASRAGTLLLVFCLVGCGSDDEREGVPRGWEDGTPVSLSTEDLQRWTDPDHPLSATASVVEGVVEIRVENVGFSCQSEFAALLRSVSKYHHEIVIYPVKPPLMKPNIEVPCGNAYHFTVSFSTASFSWDKGSYIIGLFTAYRENQTADSLAFVQVYVPD